jgi:hypothetical protein
VGLLPFVAVLAARELWRDASPGATWRALATPQNAAGILLGLVSAAYYATRFHPFALPIDVSGLHQEGFTLTLFRRGPAFLFLYPIFVALEFALLHALLYAAIWRERRLVDEPLRWLLVTSTLVLLLLPWLNLGWNNDLVMRACIPMLFVTALVTLRVLCGDGAGDPLRRKLVRAIAALLVIGVVNTAVIAGRHLEGMVRQGAWISVPAQDRVLDLFELQEQRYMDIGFNFVGQYMGSPRSPIARALLALPSDAGRASEQARDQVEHALLHRSAVVRGAGLPQHLFAVSDVPVIRLLEHLDVVVARAPVELALRARDVEVHRAPVHERVVGPQR